MDDSRPHITSRKITRGSGKKTLLEDHEPDIVINGKTTNLSNIVPIKVKNPEEILNTAIKDAIKSVEKAEKEIVKESVDGKEMNIIMEKYKKLKKRYPDVIIPVVKNKTTIELMKIKKAYKEELSKRMKKTLLIWKGVLVVSIVVSEFALKWIGFELPRFTGMHMKNFLLYTTCLEEMSEESGGISFIESASPMTRLFIYMLINSVIFIVMIKMAGIDPKQALEWANLDTLTKVAEKAEGLVGGDNGGGGFGALGDIFQAFIGEMGNNPKKTNNEQPKSGTERKRSKVIEEPDIEYKSN